VTELMSRQEARAPQLGVERAVGLSADDLDQLCEAAAAAIIEGGGFGWVKPQPRPVLETYFRGVMLVPERMLFLARLDGVVVGSAQLVRPARNNEAQAFSATLAHAFVAPYARGHGLARLLITRVEEAAAATGVRVLNLDLRETQAAAIALYEGLGYVCWGTHPAYSHVDGRTIAGRYYFKRLDRSGRATRE
jgi:phosphoribosylformimino-5-aminoimidazole carboxamide ribotide isomerase